MMTVITILISLLTIFLDSFFVALASFRILPIAVISMYGKCNWKHLLVFIFLTSLALDVVYHYVLGTNLLILVIILFLGRVISLLVPWGYNLGSYVLKYFGFVLYYVLLASLPSLISDGTLGLLSWGVVGGAFLKSIISLAICLGIDAVWGRIRSKGNSNKLRLI